MSSNSHIAEIKGFSEMLNYMEDEVTQVTLDDMVDFSNQLFKAVDSVYYKFFAELEKFVRDAHDDDTEPPSSIIPYLEGTTWPELSDSWSNWKTKVNRGRPLGFYHGTSKFRKRSRSRPFASFASSMVGNRQALEKMFGAPMMQFDVSKAGRRFTVTSNGKGVKYQRTGPTQEEKPFTKAEGRKEYVIKSTTASFPKLLPHAAGQWSEWKFVDQMITSVGKSSATAKQLKKINGTLAYGGSRKIRPLIIPTIIKQLREIDRQLKKVF